MYEYVHVLEMFTEVYKDEVTLCALKSEFKKKESRNKKHESCVA